MRDRNECHSVLNERQIAVTGQSVLIFIHPSASITDTTGSQSAPGTVVIGGTTTTTTYQFNQPPSGVDIQEAGAANLSIVVGARDKTVYVL